MSYVIPLSLRFNYVRRTFSRQLKVSTAGGHKLSLRPAGAHLGKLGKCKGKDRREVQDTRQEEIGLNERRLNVLNACCMQERLCP